MLAIRGGISLIGKFHSGLQGDVVGFVLSRYHASNILHLRAVVVTLDYYHRTCGSTEVGPFRGGSD